MSHDTENTSTTAPLTFFQHINRNNITGSVIDPSLPVITEREEPEALRNLRGTLSSLLQNLNDLDVTSKVSIGKKVDEGGFSDILLGVPRDGRGPSNLAIKRVRFATERDMIEYTKNVAREMRIWSSFSHENILILRGYIVEADTNCPSLVTEWMEKGSLRKYYINNNSYDALLLSRGIACGLSYLHGEGVVHGDLKCANVVLSALDVPQIMDFGISHLQQSTVAIEAVDTHYGSIRWQAPELFKQTGHTEESDMWAFGMTCLELLTKNVPYPNLTKYEIIAALENTEAPKEPSDSPTWLEDKKMLWDICNWCWKWDCDERPSADEVAAHLMDL